MRQLYLGLILLLSCFAISASGQITGTFSVCASSFTPLSGSPAGGTWMSSNPAVGTVSSGGLFVGLSAGTTTISYSSTPTSIVMTVYPIPSAIVGAGTVGCGGTLTLSATPGGGTWGSLFPTIATIGAGTGVVTGISAGATIVTYSLPTGCYRTDSIYVSSGSAGTLSGTSTVCVGSTTTYSSTVSGGSWSSSTTGVATVNPTTGVITGVASGVATITYTTTGSCGAVYATRTVTVTAATAPTIGGSSSVACGSAVTLSGSPAGGTWTSSTTAVGTVGLTSGIVTSISVGTTTISYTATGACGTGTATMILTVTAGSLPAITGTSTVTCGGTTTFSNTVGGGTWSSSNTSIATVGLTSGIVTGVSGGTATISYVRTTGCGTMTVTKVVTVSAGTAGTITALTTMCVGATTTATSTVSGGTWSSSTPGVATVGVTSGIVTGVAAGTTTLTYTATTACGTATSTFLVSVSSVATAAPIVGTTTITCGGMTTLTDATPGGTWSSSVPTVGTLGVSGGAATVYGLTTGTTVISYTVPVACGTAVVTTTVTVVGPSVFAIDSPLACGAARIAYAFGATSYTWAPATGLSCSTCATTNITTMATTTYTITGTTAGCSSTTTLTVSGNRIDGHITFSSTAPTVQTCKVWLVKFNPIDSSITGVDSIVTCMDGSLPYYHFDAPTGANYLVKAKLLSSVAGTSDYIPTYGASSAVWYLGTNITHAAAVDVQNINMIYGTVPAGPGFISGYVYAGAGKGTSGDAAVPGMLIYLKDATTGNILTYTYTDAAGAYSFGSLAYGSYVVYPEEYQNYTTPSSVKTLSAATPSASGVTFKQYTTSRKILPYQPAGVAEIAKGGISIHPNPSTGVINIDWANQMVGQADVVITDVTGREVYRSVVDMATVSGETSVNLSNLNAGVYILTVRSENNSYTSKLLLGK